MPRETASHIAAMKRDNPAFKVTVWGPEESRALIEREYPEFLSKYDAYPHAIQRSDFSRYAILHSVGGVYVDTDYILKKPLLSVFSFLDAHFPDKDAFVNETPNAVFLRRLSNSFMVAKTAQHPFWMHVMQTTSAGSGLSSHQRILSSTGPQAVDRSYVTFEDVESVGVLPKQYFNPCGLCSRGNACSKDSVVFAYHENAGGWNTSTGKFYNSLNCNLWWWIGLLCLVVTVCVLIGILTSTEKRCRKFTEIRVSSLV